MALTKLSSDVIDISDLSVILSSDSTPTGIKTYIDNQNAGKGDLADPNFTGIPTAPTAAPGTNTTQLATTAFAETALSSLISDALSPKAWCLFDGNSSRGDLLPPLAGFNVTTVECRPESYWIYFTTPIGDWGTQYTVNVATNLMGASVSVLGKPPTECRIQIEPADRREVPSRVCVVIYSA